MPTPKFRPPPEEKDRRLMARELFLRNMPEEEIATTTKLEPVTVHKIGEWLKQDFGQTWVKKNHPGVEFKGGKWERVEVTVPQAQGAPPGPVSSEAEGPVPPQPVWAEPEGESQGEGGDDRVATEGKGEQGGAGQELPAGGQGRQVQVLRVVTVDDQGRILDQGPPQQPGPEPGLVLRAEQGTFESGPATGKRNNAFLTPATIYYFDYARAYGSQMDLSHFIETCVTGYFKTRYGIALAFVRTVKG